MMKTQTQFLKSLLLALMLLLVLEGAARFYLGGKFCPTALYRTEDLAWKVHQMANLNRLVPEGTQWVIFMGDSKVGSGIRPAIFDQVIDERKQPTLSFNLGADGIATRGMKDVLLPELLRLKRKPDHLVIGLGPLNFWPRDLENKPYLKHSNFFSLSRLLARYSRLFACRQLLWKMLSNPGKCFKGECSVEKPAGLSDQGYFEVPQIVDNPEFEGLKKYFESKSYPLSDQTLPKIMKFFGDQEIQDFKDLLAEIKKQGIAVSVVLMPEVDYPSPYKIAEKKRFEKIVKALKTDASVLNPDANGQFQNTQSFSDTHHLSFEGATQLSLFLGKVIE